MSKLFISGGVVIDPEKMLRYPADVLLEVLEEYEARGISGIIRRKAARTAN